MKLYETMKYIERNSNFIRLKEVLDDIKGNIRRIKIVDDIDFDGTASAYETYDLCKYLNEDSIIDVYLNNKHGISNEELSKFVDYDYIFILDSSTNESVTYETTSKVIVIDHHEVQVNLDTCKDNVIVINSKLIKGCECVSAGAFCYLLYSTYIDDADDTFLESILAMGVASCYSDIVPVDETVEDLLYNLLTANSYGRVINTLNKYRKPMSKNLLQYSIIPLINYTRRLEDNATLLAVTTGRVNSLTLETLIENKRTALNLLEYAKQICTVRVNTSTVIMDITDAQKMFVQPLKNFKGLLANQLTSLHGKAAMVGFHDNGIFHFSIRSPEINSYKFFTEHNLDGGGHLPACGFRVASDEVESLILKYNTYCEGVQKMEGEYEVIELQDVTEIKRFPVSEIAKMNEFCFSNKKPTAFFIQNLDITNARNHTADNGFMISDMHFKLFKTEEKIFNALIVPTTIAFELGEYELIIRKI